MCSKRVESEILCGEDEEEVDVDVEEEEDEPLRGIDVPRPTPERRALLDVEEVVPKDVLVVVDVFGAEAGCAETAFLLLNPLIATQASG